MKKFLYIDWEKIMMMSKCIIINNDYRLNFQISQALINVWQQKVPQSLIIIMDCCYYANNGWKKTELLQQIQTTIETIKKNSKTKYLLIIWGLEYLHKFNFNFSNPNNLNLVAICSQYLHYKNHNLFFQLTQKITPNWIMKNEKIESDNPNKFLWNYCQNYWDLKNYDVLTTHWDYLIEKATLLPIQHFDHKKISISLLTKIIYGIANSPLGIFKIGKFCTEHDLRYESVMFALEYLETINFIFCIKYILKNQVHAKKKLSLYFFSYPFVYYLNSKKIIPDNLLISQYLYDYWNKHQQKSFALNYQFTNERQTELQLKLDWTTITIQLEADNFNHVIFNEIDFWQLYSDKEQPVLTDIKEKIESIASYFFKFK